MSGWDRKDIWSQSGRNFRVEVSRHEEPAHEERACYDSEGPHRWCVYVYVYPKHPRFCEFDADQSMSNQPSFGLHAGNSYFRAHRTNDGEVCSFQVGCDYHHDGDWRYTQMATADDARSVFLDAENIVEMLRNTDAQP